MNNTDTDNILSFLDGFMGENTGDVARKIASDFRRRRVEKGITREDLAAQSGVAVSNIARFERLGLVSLSNLLDMARVLGYLGELKAVFATPKYHTIEELTQIRRNSGKKRASKFKNG